jgi:hypothetical protein
MVMMAVEAVMVECLLCASVLSVKHNMRMRGFAFVPLLRAHFLSMSIAASANSLDNPMGIEKPCNAD